MPFELLLGTWAKCNIEKCPAVVQLPFRRISRVAFTTDDNYYETVSCAFRPLLLNDVEWWDAVMLTMEPKMKQKRMVIITTIGSLTAL